MYISSDADPAAVALEQVRALATPAARDHLHSLTAEDRGRWVEALQQIKDTIEVATVIATEVFDAHCDATTLNGASSTQAWIRSTCRVSAAEANERVRLGRASRTILAEPMRL